MSRHNYALKANEEVVALLEDVGIPREQILAIGRKKIGDALKMTDPSEADACEVEESGYVWRVDVNKEREEARPQGLKSQLVLSENPDVEELHQEVGELGQRTEELIEFKPDIEIGLHSWYAHKHGPSGECHY